MKAAILRFRPKHGQNGKDADYWEKLDRTEAALCQQFDIVRPARSDILIVIGGDGAMTRLTKKYSHLGRPFYGINRGTVGFLLNDHADTDDFPLALRTAEFVEFPLLEVEIVFQNDAVQRALAFNDVFTKTVSSQTAKHRISINGFDILGRTADGKNRIYAGDGLIVCTPGGSTAYNRAPGGPIIGHKMNGFCLTPVSPFLPADFRPQLLDDDFMIRVELVEDIKRRHLVVADNVEFRRVHHFTVRKAPLSVKLGFDESNSYFKKTLTLRFPWLRNANSANPRE